jgi:extradiol dioxygenase family protein
MGRFSGRQVAKAGSGRKAVCHLYVDALVHHLGQPSSKAEAGNVHCGEHLLDLQFGGGAPVHGSHHIDKRADRRRCPSRVWDVVRGKGELTRQPVLQVFDMGLIGCIVEVKEHGSQSGMRAKGARP